jgi:hypothetical protein
VWAADVRGPGLWSWALELGYVEGARCAALRCVPPPKKKKRAELWSWIQSRLGTFVLVAVKEQK